MQVSKHLPGLINPSTKEEEEQEEEVKKVYKRKIETIENKYDAALSLARAHLTEECIDLVSEAIQACDASIHRELWGKLVLTGALAHLVDTKDFVEKCGQKSKIEEASPAFVRQTAVQVVAKAAPACSEWIGGSILSSLVTMCGMWTVRQEYDSTGGPECILRKLF